MSYAAQEALEAQIATLQDIVAKTESLAERWWQQAQAADDRPTISLPASSRCRSGWPSRRQHWRRCGRVRRLPTASGAVGSVVGQIAKTKGCHAVGIAGGTEKCHFVAGELGFDACVDHRAPDFAKLLEAACPKGIDVYFENVGGAVQQTVWPLLNDFARIPVCGLIAQYNAKTPMPGPDMFSVLRKRLLLRGFIVSDLAAKQADFLRDVSEWVRAGRLKYREDIVEGLEQAPAAFLGLLQGKNFGKLLVRMTTRA